MPALLWGARCASTLTHTEEVSKASKAASKASAPASAASNAVRTDSKPDSKASKAATLRVDAEAERKRSLKPHTLVA